MYNNWDYFRLRLTIPKMTAQKTKISPTLSQEIYAYLRASTDKQDVNNQKLEILEYARSHKFNVDHFIEVTISSRRNTKQRRIDELVEKLKK